MRQLTFQRTIGAGAFGTVYLAELQTGRGFRRQVAVKVIQARGPDGDIFLSRIRDEARLLGLLQDDAILKVLDMVQIDGLDAVVMEYIEGVDLDSLVKVHGPPPPQALAELGALVAGALQRAHTATHPASGAPLGVIHRDVKPANIMVTRSGGVRLLDFGVAKARFEARESYTGQLVLGTLNYMAPEYIVSNQLSPAADIYGLGLSLYEAATGQVYGQPKVRADGHNKRLEERLGELGAQYPELSAVVRRMLAWQPEARPDGAESERLLWEVSGQSRGPSLRAWATQAVPMVLAGRQVAPDGPKLLGRTITLAEEAVVPEAEARLADSGGREGSLASGAPPAPPASPATQPVTMPSPAVSSATPPPPGPATSPPSPPPPPPAALGASVSLPPTTRGTPAPTPPPTPRPAPATPEAPRPADGGGTPKTSARPAKTPPPDSGPSTLAIIIKAVLIGGLVGLVLLALLIGALYFFVR